MDKERRRRYFKKLIITAVCMVLSAAALIAVSFAKYMTPEMRGQVRYDPALFNTVLLGKLVDSTLPNKNNPTSFSGSEKGTYTEQKDTTSVGNVSYFVTGEKLAASIKMNQIGTTGTYYEEFGAGSTDNLQRVAPGDASTGTIEFTITNGTTVAGSSGADGEDEEVTVSNIAETDIAYKLHIITTNNLPLKYKLVDTVTGTEYPLTDLMAGESYDSSLGLSSEWKSDYVVSDTSDTDSDDSRIFQNGIRILKKLDDNTITVHRYKLLISWVLSEDEDSETDDYSSKYMKELENVQVLAEVNSFVKYTVAAGTVTANAEGVMVLGEESQETGTGTTDKSDLSTYVPHFSVSSSQISSVKTVRYSNFAEDTDAAAAVGTSKTYNYQLHVYNGDRTAATWVDASGQAHLARTWVQDAAESTKITTKEDPLKGLSKTRADNRYGQYQVTTETGTETVAGEYTDNGHYEYYNNFLGGNYGLRIAIPNEDGRKYGISEYDRTGEEYEYRIIYNGDTYIGVPTDNETVSTDVTLIKKTWNGSQNYDSDREDVYTAYKFVKVVDDVRTNTELRLSCGSGDSEVVHDLTLQMIWTKQIGSGGAAPDLDTKDDFRIYIYSLAGTP